MVIDSLVKFKESEWILIETDSQLLSLLSCINSWLKEKKITADLLMNLFFAINIIFY